LISKCLFPAAGYGTRFLPATKAVPKEMLPILTKPLLQYAVEEAISSGITNMAIVTGRGKRAIEDHFDNSFELDAQLKGTSKEHYLHEIKEVIEKATFTYVRQQKMLGLGHAILTGEPLIGNEAFAVILADDLCSCNAKGVMEQMIEVYHKYQCSIVAIEEIPINQSNKYGVIAGNLISGSSDTFLATDMIEKPDSKDAPSNMAIIGRYILTPDIFKILKEIKPGINNEIQITDALKIQAKKGKVIAYKFKGNRFDCGTIKGFLEATNYFANKLDIVKKTISVIDLIFIIMKFKTLFT
jgi:UTP--glucose-1-phosphate uridylyltransferase